MRYLQAGSGPPLILLHGLMGYSFSWRFTIPSAVAPRNRVRAGPVRDRLLRSPRATRLPAVRDGRSAFQISGCRWRLFLRFAGDVARRSSRHDGRLDARDSPRSSPAQTDSGGARQSVVGARSAARALSRQSARVHSVLAHRELHALDVSVLARPPLWRQQAHSAAERSKVTKRPVSIPGSFEYAVGIVRHWTNDLRELEHAIPKLADIPTLLVWGSADPAVYVQSAEQLRRHFKHCEVVVYPGVGHLPYEEVPEQFSATVREFLQGS